MMRNHGYSTAAVIGVSAFAALLLTNAAAALSSADFLYGAATNGAYVLPYRYYVPTNYYAGTPQRYPLIVYLHGSGERGSDNEAQLQGGAASVFQFLSSANQDAQPCFLVAPQCPANVSSWSTGPTYACVKPMVDKLIAAYPIDTNRLCITGLSLGGNGVWWHSYADPRYATLIPICGAQWTNPSDSVLAVWAPKSMWLFHGSADGTVPVSNSRYMVDVIRKAGGSVIYTEYPGQGHSIWGTAYGTPGLYSWIMAQRLGQPVQGVPCARVVSSNLLANPVILAGTASPQAQSGAALTAVVWDNDAGTTGAAAGTTNWSADVPSHGGTNRITITASDNRNTTFNATLKFAILTSTPTDFVSIDFGAASATTPGNWNNITDPVSGSLANMTDDSGSSTAMGMAIVQRFNSGNSLGTTTPSPSLGIPATASQDNFYGNTQLFGGTTCAVARLRVTGLDTNRVYSFVFFGSRVDASATDSRQTQYTVIGTNRGSGCLESLNNSNTVATISGIAPCTDGHVDIEVTVGPANNNAYGFYYLNAMKIHVTSNTTPQVSAYYVSPGGSDTNTGTLTAPFATLEHARDAIRAVKSAPGLPAGRVTVWLRGGVYARTNTFELTAEDAGSPDAPVTWRACTGEEVRVVGATQLNPSWFTVVIDTSPVWSRLDTSARGQIMQVDLASHGITNYGALRVRGFNLSAVAALELFFTNAPMPLARYPDPDMDDPAQCFTNNQITVYGDPGPIDVTGSYVVNGTTDGVNRYSRVGLVNGKQYYLYRYTWEYPAGTWFTAWFVSTRTSGHPRGSTDPWWIRYGTNLGPPMNVGEVAGTTGSILFQDPAKISRGWMTVSTVTGPNTFTYADTRPERWAQAEEPWFQGYWAYYWADDHLRGTSIATNTKTITLGQNPPFGILPGQSFYAENLLEEVTHPGEWYLNRTTGILYFWPPAPMAGADIWVSMLEQPLWRLKNTTNVVVRDVTLEMGRADLVAIEGGTRNAFIHCTLRNAGNYAGRVGGTSNGVSSCSILHLGDGGIVLSGAGSRDSLVPVRNFVRNCDIRDFSRWSRTYKPATLIESETVGCLVSHNSMHDSPHTAILFGRCNDNLIEFNDVGNVCNYSADAGAIYSGRDWAARGNVIRHNFLHDIDGGLAGFGGTHGIYLDDRQSGVQVFGNVLCRISGEAIAMGGGRDNLMENNVIARCGTGITAVDARRYDTGDVGCSNIWRDLQNYPYQGTLWSNAYPLCAAIPNNWTTVTNTGNWLHPQGNVFSRNIGFANTVWTQVIDNAFAYFKEITNNLGDTDPLFVDESNHNPALQTNSPAYTIPGFQPIPSEQIGLESNKVLSVRIQGQGAVTVTQPESTYYPMQFVHLAATPSNMWYFAGWTNDAAGAANSADVWMTNDMVVTAVFLPCVAANNTPFWWLDRYGLATNDSGAMADTDGDGFQNWQEYIAGTDPTDPASKFTLQSVNAGVDDIRLSFAGTGHRAYDVEYRDDLLDSEGWRLFTNVVLSGDTILEIVDSTPAPQRFYRVRARIP